MANECLITKLKGTVDNPNLLKFGEVRFVVKNNTPFGIGYSNATAKIISGPGNFYTNNDVLIGKEISGGTFAFLKDVTENTTISIMSKYNLNALEGYSTIAGSNLLKYSIINLDDFKYSPLAHLKLNECEIYGNTNIFKDYSSFGTFMVQLLPIKSHLIASINDFVKNVNLTNLSLLSENIITNNVETFESFVEGQFANGRRSGSILFSVFNRKFTLNNIVAKDFRATYSDNSVNVYSNDFDDTRLVNATYDGTSWTYS